MTESELIYHYTSAQGLKGIIENQAIWATDVWYMNDTREATFGFDMIEEFVTSKLDSTDGRGSKRAKFYLDMLQSFRQQQDNMPSSFIACFSKNGDQLSQWRAYCPSGGFSIGFDKTMLEQLTTEATGVSPHTMREVIYGREHQFLAIDSHYRRFEGDIGLDAASFIKWAYILAPALKNDAFREEAEVRLHLFQDANSDNGSSPKFRISTMGLTPYLDVKIANSERSPIREIIIGPTAHPVQTERAVKQFLRGKALKDVTVRHSEIPLRT